MLPILAALNLASAWLVWALATAGTPRRNARVEIAPELSSEAPRSGLRALTSARYLRNLAALVLLGSAAASLMDYVFKAEAVAAFGPGDGLLRFFAIYYAGVSVITFFIQAGLSSVVMEKLGLAVSAATPSLALAAGGAVAAAAPGIASATVARGAESACRGSLFRSSYEVFYTPVPPKERRAAKSLIDVGCDRLGDALGAGVIRSALMLTPTYQHGPLVLLSVGCSAIAVLFATRLHRGYIHTLERSLLNRAVELDLSDVEDTTTRTVMLQTLPAIRARATEPTPDTPAVAAARRPPIEKAVPTITALAQDPELRDIAALRTRDRDKILRVLQSQKLTPALVPHVIPLLAWDAVAAPALDALRRIADERTGELIDALVDQEQDFAVRRRLARVFASCTTQRAADGVALGLNDHRFEVRFQCARSLVTIVDRNRNLRVDREFIFEVVQRETAVGRPVWESHRLLNQRDDRDEKFFVDDFVKDRADRSLAHVFTLLSLVLPAEPLRIAFRGLHTNDPALRGTALEYLEGILPATIRERLWPFLEDRRTTTKTVRPRDEILADLLRSHASIVLNLEELQRRSPSSKEKPWPTT
jgi:ATP:ADP antiporter, AAA family